MQDYQQKLDIISRVRGEVMGRKEQTGVNLFLVWGYPTVFVLLLEFAGLMIWHENWCSWLWAGVPLIGGPLMAYFVNKDYERTHNQSLEQSIAIQLWLFIAAACCIGGFTTGYAGVFEQCYCTFEGVLISLGCFLTGVISRFRPMRVCGIIGAVLSFACLFLQDNLWPWQLIIVVVVAVIALIIPGHLSRSYVKRQKR